MRQLLIWAVQKVASVSKDQNLLCSEAESLVQALFTNKINASWYQRPSEVCRTDPLKLGPKNQELLDCIQLYERYSQRYTAACGREAQRSRLKSELTLWEDVKTDTIRINQMATAVSCPPSTPQIQSLPNEQLQGLANWLNTLPTSTDQLHWTLSVVSSFEAHARSFCESVFYQIRARLLGDADHHAPMLLLRALSTTAVN